MKFKFLLSLICLMSFGINSLFSQPPSIPCPDDKIIGSKIYEWVAPGIWRYKADLPGTLSALDCASATHYGTLYEVIPASGVSSTVTYTGGNGGYHNGQTVTSTGVTGMTATLVAGTFASGIGTLTYNISGTPTTSGTALFALNIGGQQCTLTSEVYSVGTGTYPPGTVHCSVVPTAVVDVTNSATNKTWMDRNLGASRVALSSTDANSYGGLYQWGRRADGHQCRTSATTTTLSNSDQPTHGNFIVAPTSPQDWRSPQNTNLWQGVNGGVNNPCPGGYRLPTNAEWDAERTSWISQDQAGAFASPLKLPLAGRRLNNGSINTAIGAGYYSSTVSNTLSFSLTFSSTGANSSAGSRVNGHSVRCLKVTN